MLFMLSVASMSLGESLKGTAYIIEEKNNAPSSSTVRLMEGVRNYVKTGWKPSKSLSWTKVNDTLSAQTFSVPRTQTRTMRQKLGVSDFGSPLVLIYRGKVKAPFSGKFRFIGTGDDVLLVRWNSKLVLEGGLMLPTVGIQSVSNSESDVVRKQAGRGFGIMKMRGVSYRYAELGSMTAGSVITVKKGGEYDITILYGDSQGMAGYSLMMQRLKNTGSAPCGLIETPVIQQIQPFRVGAAPVSSGEETARSHDSEHSESDDESLIWEVVEKVQAPGANLKQKTKKKKKGIRESKRFRELE